MPPHRRSLASLTFSNVSPERFIADDRNYLPISDLQSGSCFEIGSLQRLRGCSVLLATATQLPSVLATMELDGIAGRVLLCTPDLIPHLPAIIAEAQVDAVVSDGSLVLDDNNVPLVRCGSRMTAQGDPEVSRDVETEWVLFTSGTTGRPKMVAHTLSSLSGPLDDGVTVASGAVWSTFYDTRRYGGLQILLRALIGGGSIVLSSAGEPVDDFLTRLAARRITHISGTPSHWRRALMTPSAAAISPAYVRLSGEVADQAILDRLHRTYPASSIAHAFASTEAGVAFDVRDGIAGFPVSMLDHPPANVQMRIEAGTLRIRSSRCATRYLGHSLRQTDGFIDTGDLVERRGDRYFFVGRREGVINVGGLKVFPEEVESVISAHPDVQMVRVWPRKSPITGAVVAADVVLRPNPDNTFQAVRAALINACRQALAAHKVPVTLRQVDSIDVTSSGKIARA